MKESPIPPDLFPTHFLLPGIGVCARFRVFYFLLPAMYQWFLPLWCLKGGAGGQAPANRAFRLLSCPHPPDPLPGGKGETKVFFMQGAAPLASPRLSRRRHLQSQPNRFPAQRKAHSLPQKVTGVLFSEQCRQPRRGGTGGDGTIRRKRRRRLRWSSPPGQGEQVPLGFILPPSPRVPQRQGQPATRKARPPAGHLHRRFSPCRSGSALGMQGAKPLA